jgi:hypothetical protein
MKKLSEATIKELTDWAQDVVDELAKKKTSSAYEVRLTLSPNPINYDGVNQVKIELYDRNSKYNNIKNAFSFDLKEALKEIGEKLIDVLK